MNSKLEKLLLTKDFDHLSSNDKLFVTEFMTEFEYADCRDLLMRSNEVFLRDKVNLKQPELHKKLLLQAYRKKYGSTESHAVSKRKNAIYYLSDPRITGIAAILIIGLFIFNLNSNLKSSKADPNAVTEFLLQGKELPETTVKDFQPSSMNKATNLLEKESDSVLKVFQAMNRYMTIDTYALEAGVRNISSRK